MKVVAGVMSSKLGSSWRMDWRIRRTRRLGGLEDQRRCRSREIVQNREDKTEGKQEEQEIDKRFVIRQSSLL